MSDTGTELLHVCQDGKMMPQTGFVRITNEEQLDVLFVTQVGAKAHEATLYRKSHDKYVRVGWWSGWEIRATQWNKKPAIHYEELEPTVEHPKNVVYFVWDGQKLVPNRPDNYSFHP